MFLVVWFSNPPGSFSTSVPEIGVKKKTIHSVHQLLIGKGERIKSSAITGLRQALGVVNLVKAERQDEHRHAHGKSLGDGVASQKWKKRSKVKQTNNFRKRSTYFPPWVITRWQCGKRSVWGRYRSPVIFRPGKEYSWWRGPFETMYLWFEAERTLNSLFISSTFTDPWLPIERKTNFPEKCPSRSSSRKSFGTRLSSGLIRRFFWTSWKTSKFNQPSLQLICRWLSSSG